MKLVLTPCEVNGRTQLVLATEAGEIIERQTEITIHCDTPGIDPIVTVVLSRVPVRLDLKTSAVVVSA